MQDELAGLERQLQYIDQVKATDNPRLLKSRDLDVSRRKHDRPDVLEVIKNKLEEYGKFLLSTFDQLLALTESALQIECCSKSRI